MRVTRTSPIALSLLLALSVLGFQVVGVSHALTTRHAVCPEHGEVVHAGQASDRDGLDTVGTVPEAAHDHGCPLLTGLSDTPAVTSAPASWTLAELPGGPDPAEPHVEAALPRETLAFAPKTSPPSFATT